MSKDGMNYVPEMKSAEVVERGEFVFAASHFDHGHIYGQTLGLHNAGGVCKYIYEPDTSLHGPLASLISSGTRIVDRFEDILEDPEVQLVTSAAIPDLRCDIGLQVMEAGKDYFTDKAPVTTFEQLDRAREAVEKTGRKYAVSYSERLGNESAWHAGTLIDEGAIGRVLQVMNLAPHNLAAASRPEWFFRRSRAGGILNDIGSHQFEQFLSYTNSDDAVVNFARTENFSNPLYPEFEDFGEASLTMSSGASAYCRLDWFNPEGSRVWGDGRTFVLGEKGYMEIRKYVDVGREGDGDRIYLVDNEGEKTIDCHGKIGFPFYGLLILDCLNGTEKAMSQVHAFKAAELALKAQREAEENRLP